MRTAEQILGKSKSMTVKDLKKVLKHLPDDAVVQVPSHMSAGYYTVHSSGIKFDDEKIWIGD